MVSITASPSRLRNASFVLIPRPHFGCFYPTSLLANDEDYEVITLAGTCCRSLLEPLLPDVRRLHTAWLRGPSVEVEAKAKAVQVVKAWEMHGRVEMACEASAMVLLPLRVNAGEWGEV